jgi:hypothetical protein
MANDVESDKKRPSEENILCVIEKTIDMEALIDSDSYNNFSLRQIVYHHKERDRYELYTPLVAVNETSHTLMLCGHDGKDVHAIGPKKNLLVDLRCLIKDGMHVRIDGYQISQMIDLTAIDMHKVLPLRPDRKQKTN